MAWMPPSFLLLPRQVVAFVPFLTLGLLATVASRVMVGKYPSWAVQWATWLVMLSLATFCVLAVWHLRRA